MIVEHPKKVPIIMRLNLMSHEHQGKSADLGKDDGDEHAKEGIWRDPRGKDRQNLELVLIYFVAFTLWPHWLVKSWVAEITYLEVSL